MAPLHLYGGSQGALNALHFARSYPSLVGRIALHVPLIGFRACYQANPFNVGPGWAQSHGGAPQLEAVIDGLDPAQHPEYWVQFGSRMRLWAADDDEIVPAATARAFATAAGASVVSLGAVGGHGAGAAALAPTLVVDWLLST